MSSTEPVPETRMMPGDELSADDAFLALRHYGRWHLVRDAFVRFRYGDGVVDPTFSSGSTCQKRTAPR